MYASLLIEQVEFLDNYSIKIRLSSGHCVFYDMQPKLETIRFSELKKKRVFQQGRVIEGQFICWESNIELTLAEVLDRNYMNSP